jgi:hypothetical protein
MVEVSSRDLPEPLNAALAAKRTRLTWIAASLAVVMTLVVIGAQPIRAPWWLYADADATYAASSIDLMAGEHTFYLDHPGMPLQDLMAMTVELRYLAHRLAHPHSAAHAYAGERLLNLRDSVPWWRGYGILFYALGSLLAFLVCARLYGSPFWGLGGSLLWLGAPGLAAMSIQYRPDVPLAALLLAVGYLIVRAARARDALLYIAAAGALGVALTVKIHAAALAVPLAIALLSRWPGDSAGPALRRLVRVLHRFRVPLAVAVAVWVAFAVDFNRTRLPSALTHQQRWTTIDLVLALAAYLAIVLGLSRSRWRRRARGPLSTTSAAIVSACALGIALPATLFLDDAPEMLVKIVTGLTGGGINENVAPFTIPWSALVHGQLLGASLLLLIAVAAGLVGLGRRDPEPLLWASGALIAALMAAARVGSVHYFAPAYVLSVPAALWLARQLPRRVGALAAAAIVAVGLVSSLARLYDPANAASKQQAQWAEMELLGRRLLGPNDVAVTDIDAPGSQTRFFGTVQNFVAWTPAPRYTFVQDYDRLLPVVQAQGSRLAYYIGRLPLQLSQEQTVNLALGRYTLHPLPETFDSSTGIGAARLIHGQGVDSPIGHADSRYDPETGYFKDPGGHYWDAKGGAVVKPLRRTYVASLKLWRDRFGDYWNAQGKRVRP